MRIAIIGGGAAGAICAIHLLRNLQAGARIDLFDPSAELGRGIAYAEQPAHFLLNVAAASMSWSGPDSLDFVEWLETSGLNIDPWREADGSPFLPRAIFGRHLNETLSAAIEAAKSRVSFQHHRNLVEHIGPGPLGLRGTVAGMTAQDFTHAIVTIGNAPPAPLAVKSSNPPRAVQSAWDIRTADIAPQERVVILGAGLTMADCLAELEARGHQGPITCISRNGRSPRPALGTPPEFSPKTVPSAAKASLFLREFRQMVAECVAETGDWRPAFAWARRNSAQLWRGLDRAAQQRLRRHVRPMWDIHRYLMPPAAARRMQALMASGRLEHLQARAIGLGDGGLLVSQNGHEVLLPADLVINATGFDGSYRTAAVPPKNLLDLTPEEQSRLPREGLCVDDTGLLQIAANTGRIFALGHLVRGNHGEMGTINAFGTVSTAIAQHLKNQQQATDNA